MNCKAADSDTPPALKLRHICANGNTNKETISPEIPVVSLDIFYYFYFVFTYLLQDPSP